MTDEKKCKYCGKILVRRIKRGVPEHSRNFRNREFCNRSCAAKFQHSSDDPEKKAVSKASDDVKTGTEQEVKTAIEILEMAANNEKLDWITRINAAKALAPYQGKRASAAVGKKVEQQGAAQTVASGRFGTSKAPTIVPIKKQG